MSSYNDAHRQAINIRVFLHRRHSGGGGDFFFLFMCLSFSADLLGVFWSLAVLDGKVVALWLSHRDAIILLAPRALWMAEVRRTPNCVLSKR